MSSLPRWGKVLSECEADEVAHAIDQVLFAIFYSNTSSTTIVVPLPHPKGPANSVA